MPDIQDIFDHAYADYADANVPSVPAPRPPPPVNGFLPSFLR